MAFVQALGMVSVILYIVAFQINSRKKILYFQSLSLFIFSIHLLFLDALTGGIITFINSSKVLLFSFRYKFQGNNILYFFIFTFIISTFLTWEGYHSILAGSGVIIATMSHWQKRPKYIRFIFALSAIPWIVYHFLVSSYPGILLESVILFATTLGIVRFDIMKK